MSTSVGFGSKGCPMTLRELARMTEDDARELIEGILWPKGPVCPHCGVVNNAVRLAGGATRAGLFKCRDCREQFTVTVNTIMHRSKVPLAKWLMAFHLMCSSKKGVSALQLQRELGLGSYQTAWHMAHRVRYAMNACGFGKSLKGDVEADETYVGGKPRKGTKTKAHRGRGTKKQALVVLVERNGRAKTRVVANVAGATLKREIRRGVHRSARILTDEWGGYNGIGLDFEGEHETVCHSRGEYARGDVHSNTAESFFALLKRGIVGAFHHVSKEHLWRYADEFEFRWNHRKVSDHERTLAAIGQSGGKQLPYRVAIGRT